MAVASSLRSDCPIAGTLDVLGDRWTLLIIRDLLRGKHRYGEFADAPEGIPTNILAERLVRLEACGIVERTPYQKRPVRHAYALTAKGRDLKPVIAAVGVWGQRHVPDTRISKEMRAAVKA